MSPVVRNVLGLFLVGSFVTWQGIVYLQTNQRLDEVARLANVQLSDEEQPTLPQALQDVLKASLGIETVNTNQLPADFASPTPTLTTITSPPTTHITQTFPTYTTTTEEQTITNTTYVTSNIELGDLPKSRLLYINNSNALGSLGEGSAGQILQSNGSGSLPSWVDISATGLSTSLLSGEQLQVGSGYPLAVDSAGRLTLEYNGDSGYLSSSGGAIFIDNTNNIGTGIGIYSNAGSEALGNMINVKVDNPAYNQAAFYMNYDGLSNAVEIVSNSNDSSSNALAVTGNNINDSTLGIIGYELGKGTIKVSHYRPGSGNDQNASAISVDLKGVGTRAQGLYVDSTETGGTLGNLLRLRNESIDKFVVNYQGNLTMTGNITQGAYGTDTTYTKYGNTTGDQFFVGTNGSFRVQRAASNSEAFRVQINGDTQGRWVGTSDGRLRWGDGSNASDVTLRRGATGTLWLDGGIVLNNLNETYNIVFKGVNDSNLLVTNSSSNRVGIGLSQPLAPFHISKNGGGNAAMIIDQLGSADILTASSSGTTRFKLTQSGDMVVGAGGAWLPLSDTTSALSVKTSTGSAVMTYDTVNARVGIGTTTPGASLHVFGGDIYLENGQALRIKNSAGSASPTLSYSTGNNLQLYNYASSGVVQIGINNASNTGSIRFFTNNNVERMRIDPAGVGVGATSFGTSAVNVLAIASSTAPSTSITDGIQLFAVDQAGSHELRVRDEAGNVSTLSPHNFSLIPDGRSEDLAWSFYSERGSLAINADMTKALRVVEALSGEQLLYIKDLQSNQYLSSSLPKLQLASQAPLLVQPPTSDLVTSDFLTATLSGYLRQEAVAQHISFLDGLVHIWSKVIFSAEVTFDRAVAFVSDVRFRGMAIFEGPLIVNRDTAGTIMIPAGAKTVKVTFATPFAYTPIVYLTPNRSLGGEYVLEEVTETGFVISLSQAVEQSQTWQWLAVLSQGEAGQVEVLETEAVDHNQTTTTQVEIPGPAGEQTAPSPNGEGTALPVEPTELPPGEVAADQPTGQVAATPTPQVAGETTATSSAIVN